MTLPDSWQHPTWQALEFSVDYPHFYSYQFESIGTGVEAEYTAYAFGDLDCDGQLSTYVARGHVNDDLSTRAVRESSDELE